MGAPNYLIVETELVVIELTAQDRVLELAGRGTGASAQVRRPLRGIQIKEDTYAALSVLGPGGGTLLNSSSFLSENFTSNFILQSVQESRQEKFQPLTTFGATYGFFFGENPRMINFGAILLNTADFQWELEWWANYDNVLRGTKLADRGLRAYLTYDDVIIEGYVTAAGTTKSAGEPHTVLLNFSMWVTDVIPLITAGADSVDKRHKSAYDDGGSEGFANLEAQREALSGADSTTLAVRQKNLESATGGGLLAALRAGTTGLQGFVGKVGNALSGAKDFLYGRNMVIPAGFAGSEWLTGEATFASGSGSESLIGQELGGILQVKNATMGASGSTLSIRVPGTVTGVTARGTGKFWENYDEYPHGASARAGEREALAVIEGLGLTNDPQDSDEFYLQLAEATFKDFGYDITSEDGWGASDLARAAGAVAFAALSYAAMTSGVSQAAASLSVGSVVGDATASEEEAALEAARESGAAAAAAGDAADAEAGL